MFIPRFLFHLKINTRAKYQLYKLCVKYNPNIIHTNVSVLNIGYCIANKLNIPHVYHIREYQNLDFGMRIIPSLNSFKNKLTKKNNYTICITRGIQQHFQLQPTNSEVIYDGVMKKENIHFHKEKCPYFLFVGRLEDAKGIKDVIKSFAKFRTQNNQTFELWVVGASHTLEYNKDLGNLVKELQIDKYVKFMGVRDDVEVLMQNATALIMSSQSEGFGLVTAEAMFNGCLVIGRNTGGTKEQFDNGLNLQGCEIGLRFETEDELANRMLSIVNNGIETFR